MVPMSDLEIVPVFQEPERRAPARLDEVGRLAPGGSAVLQSVGCVAFGVTKPSAPPGP
jgi:hypothetical protein